MLRVTGSVTVPESDLTETFIRASGPGGQHVNKTSTAVQLRLNTAACTSLPEEVKARLLETAGNRATKQGEIVIEASRFRSRELNRRDARARLAAMIRTAAARKTVRRPVRPARAVKERRLLLKKLRSRKKQLRKKPDPND